MKLLSRFIPLIFLASISFVGCGHESSPSNVNAADSKPQPNGMNLEGKAKEAMGAAKDAVAKGKDEWKKFSDKEMPELDQQIAQLKEKVAKSSGTAKAELDKLVQEISEQRQALDSKLGELKASGSEQWQNVKGEVSHAVTELQKSIDQALEKSK